MVQLRISDIVVQELPYYRIGAFNEALNSVMPPPVMMEERGSLARWRDRGCSAGGVGCRSLGSACIRF